MAQIQRDFVKIKNSATNVIIVLKTTDSGQTNTAFFSCLTNASIKDKKIANIKTIKHGMK